MYRPGAQLRSTELLYSQQHASVSEELSHSGDKTEKRVKESSVKTPTHSVPRPIFLFLMVFLKGGHPHPTVQWVQSSVLKRHPDPGPQRSLYLLEGTAEHRACSLRGQAGRYPWKGVCAPGRLQEAPPGSERPPASPQLPSGEP